MAIMGDRLMFTIPKNRSRPTYRGATCVLMVAALAAGLSACSRPVGLADCYEDMPLAEGALNAPRGSYQFHGVKLVSPADMAKLVHKRFPHNPPALYTPPTSGLHPGAKVCAFAFTGSFPAGQVATAPPQASGKAAVVLTTTDRKLLFSFVLAKLPEAFGRTFTRP
jgi:hypothetical protein